MVTSKALVRSQADNQMSDIGLLIARYKSEMTEFGIAITYLCYSHINDTLWVLVLNLRTLPL